MTCVVGLYLFFRKSLFYAGLTVLFHIMCNSLSPIQITCKVAGTNAEENENFLYLEVKLGK